uniref:PDZ domain-containing protein n=1 Tax=Peronospora matthiolae TaxID=2874970 RepID=A0AAV1T5M4_9STRA
MGAALCTCGSRDDHGFSRLRLNGLQATRAPAAVVSSYGVFPHASARHKPQQQQQQQLVDHDSLLLRRGETYALSDDDDNAIEGMGNSYSRRYGTAQAYANAFRAKLQEPPLSPHSKFTLLSSRYSSGSPTESSRGGDSGCTYDESASAGVAGRKKGRRQQAHLTMMDDVVSVDHTMFDLTQDPVEDDDCVTEDEWKQRANPLVTIIVPPGPCGLVLQLDREELGAPVVDGFVRHYDGKKSTIENSRLVQKGSVLCAINDVDVTRMPLKEVVRTLNVSSHLERTFTFRNRFRHRNVM